VLFITALTVGLALVGFLVALTDGRELLRTAASIRPVMLVLPVVLTLLSYATMSRSYQGIAVAAQVRLPFRDWLRITFVSNTVNYLVTSAGLSGFAVRMFLLAQQGVPSGRAVLISLVQTFLTNFTLLLVILGGFVTLLVSASLPRPAITAAAVAVCAFTAVLGWAVVLVFNRRLRRRTLFYLANAAHVVLRRVVPRWTPGRVHLWRFQHDLNAGLEFLLSTKSRMAAPAFWILLDWALTVSILWSAFRAVNHTIAPGLVVVGFAVGICLSLVSLVPGGLGVMETSMTAVFVSLGVPAEPAVVAVLIFRVAYYILPLLVSLFFFHGVMLQAVHGVSDSGRARFDTPLRPPI
jgi:uncharacterized protein (TIRG00374 family)